MTPYAAAIFAAEPRLWAIHEAAASLEPGDWKGWERAVKRPMAALVGYLAGDDAPAALRTPAAYEAVYLALLDAWELQGSEEAADAA
jgi:hypothetical protein